MARHTPGRWRHERGAIIAQDRTSSNPEAIVHVAKVGAFDDKELLPFNRARWTADADLIAAAPDLLAVARAYMQAGRHNVDDDCDCDGDCLDALALRIAVEDLAVAAISRATGGAS